MFSWLTGEQCSALFLGIMPDAPQENGFLRGSLMLVWVFFFQGYSLQEALQWSLLVLTLFPLV